MPSRHIIRQPRIMTDTQHNTEEAAQGQSQAQALLNQVSLDNPFMLLNHKASFTTLPAEICLKIIAHLSIIDKVCLSLVK